jgi:hypothetical protein
VAPVVVALTLNVVAPVVEQQDKMLLFVPRMANTEKVEHKPPVAPEGIPAIPEELVLQEVSIKVD